MTENVRDSKVLKAVSVYWLVSILMVFINRSLVSSSISAAQHGSHELIVDTPLLIAWYQSMCTVFLCWLLGKFGVGGVQYPEVRKSQLIEIAPLSVVYVAMTFVNSLCLRYVEVSFYQVARSLTIVFNVLLSYFLMGSATSPRALACCGVVIFGFLLGNQQEVRWSLKSVVYGVLSAVLVALNAIYIKRKLDLVDENPWRLTLHNHINASFMFIPLVLLSGEPATLLNSEPVYTMGFWTAMTLLGLLGVSISVATAEQIRYTSPLSHSISSTAKAATQTVLVLWGVGSSLAFLGQCSVLMVLAGALAYTLVRRQEMLVKRGRVVDKR